MFSVPPQPPPVMTWCLVLSQLQYSMCTVDVSLLPCKLQTHSFWITASFQWPHIPALMLISEYLNSVGHLIMVFEYFPPVLLYKNDKLTVTAWPNSVNASVFYSIHQQHLLVIILVISDSESEHYRVFRYITATQTHFTLATCNRLSDT